MEKETILTKWGARIAGVITFSLSIWNFYSGCQQEELNIAQKLINDSISFQTNAILYRPEIALAQHPLIRVDSILNGRDSVYYDSTSSTLHVDRSLDYFLFAKYRIYNKGRFRAKLLSAGLTDTTSKSDILRKYLLMNPAEELFSNVERVDHELQLSSGDSITIDFHVPLRFIRDNLYTMHFHLLYANEMGNLFDTYITTTHRINMAAHYNTLYTGYNFSTLLDVNVTSHSYAPSQADQILSLYRKRYNERQNH